ncbi:MAG TPA: hypothetical protein PLQ97_10035 [Myxococcota bacterium]|nr:hypothetical protein [Myxococcota bacterium]HQK51218.1 hypothetical protein [Myxococcota bacterium]
MEGRVREADGAPSLWPDTPVVRRVCGALAGVAALWAVVLHATGPVLPYDDAYITFRYADHLAEGLGPVYNEGERVFGSSSPLYVAWLALGKTLLPGVPTPDLAVRGNLLWLLAAGAALLWLVRVATGNGALGAFGAAVFLLNPQVVAVSLGGMETLAFVTLAMATLAAGIRGRAAIAGSLAGLALLARPEALILPVAILPGLVLRGRRPLLVAALAWAAVAALWVLPATAWFGTPIPHSVLAKARPLYPLPPLGSLSLFSWWTGRWAFGGLGESLGHLRTLPVILLSIGATVPWLARSPGRDRRGWAIPVAWFAILAFYGLGNPLPFEWYWPCLWVFLLVLLVTGLPALVPRTVSRPGVAAAMTGLVGAWLLLVTMAPWGRTCDGGPPDQDLPPASQVACDPSRLRILAYREAARRIAQEALPGETLSGPEIGALGYDYPGKVLDACGLVSPEALPFLPVPPDQRASPIDGAISTDFVQALRPDWVAFLPFFARASLLRSSWFERHYRPAFSVPLPTPCWGSRAVEVYRRVPDEGRPGT